MGGAPTFAWPYTFAWCPATSSGEEVRRNLPLTGKPPKPRISGMPLPCSSGRAPPPAPTKTKRARTVCRAPVRTSRTSTVQRPSVPRVSFCTRAPVCTCTPRPAAWSTISLVRAPKLTSVPAIDRVAATTCSGSRPVIISGSHSASASWPSAYSRPSNSGSRDSASCRARM
jgi:hypothetical protein